VSLVPTSETQSALVRDREKRERELESEETKERRTIRKEKEVNLKGERT